MMKKLLIGLGGTVVIIVAVLGGIRGYMVWEQGQDLLPAFTDVPAGPRAPTREFLGLEIRKSSVEEAEVHFNGLGVKCLPSSFRALMEAKRIQVKKEMEEVRAAGGDPDTVSGASLVNYRSKKERNPQVRLSCEDVPPATFTDRERAPGDDLYWLIIFDSPKHPLRHTSISRRIGDNAVAAEEWRSAVDNLTKRFGAPTSLRSPDNTPNEVPWSPGTSYVAKWEFADVVAEVKAFRIGKDVRFTETVEVPWPVRSD